MRNYIALLLALVAVLSGAYASEKEAKLKPDRKMALLNFMAGGLAGTVSSCLTAPLEVIKTQLQSSRVSGKLNPDRKSVV